MAHHIPAEAAKMQQIAPKAVVDAIRKASDKTGVDFSYLMAQAKAESSFNPKARARTSSATGLYQFIDRTWLQMVQQHGEKHGLGKYAQAIETGRNGSPFVRDAEMRKEILDLRKDPEIASMMAAELARDNRQNLESRLGRKANATDLYMAHFLGAGGAAQFLSTLDKTPEKQASTLLPEAAKSNAAVFYDPAKKARSVADIYALFAGKFNQKWEQIVPPAGAVMLAEAGATLNAAGAAALSGAKAADTAETEHARQDNPRRKAYGRIARAATTTPVIGRRLSPSLIWTAAQMNATLLDMTAPRGREDGTDKNRMRAEYFPPPAIAPSFFI
ncbi:MAG: lytic transglycosylase domain-containing protein [Micavibrio sp.]|nr:MAG: lytic transglycosylase domain-containing protein [Micavibrio sp.]